MAEGGYGGYEYDFVGEIDKKYLCLVCQNVLRDPILTECCGQHYCQSCLEQCSKNHIRGCPHCRKSRYRTILDRPLKREIDLLNIHCVNRTRRNCQWEDELAKLPHHLSSTCPQREHECKKCGERYTHTKEAHQKECPHYRKEATCTFQGPTENNEIVACGKKIPCSELRSHQKICPFRTYECKFCNKASTYVAITGETQTDIKQPKIPPEKGHYAQCPDFPLYCRNKCKSKQITRRDMKQHLQECPLELIQCERWEEGCGEMVRRKDMGKHMKAYEKEHREYVWCAYVQNKREAEHLRTELSTARDELAVTKHELNATKTELATKTAELNTKTAELNTKTAELNAKTVESNGTKNELTVELNGTKNASGTTGAQLNTAKERPKACQTRQPGKQKSSKESNCTIS